MAHHPLIGGTSYKITKGRTLIGGTGYDVTKGKTLVGGTAYDIPLTSGAMQAFCDLMATATPNISLSAGRNNSSTGYVSFSSYSITFPIWVLSIFNGEFSWTKFTDFNTKTVIYQSSASYGNCYNNGGTFYYSHTGSSQTSVYGACIFGFSFSGYTEQEVDAILAGVKKKTGAGRNASSTSTVSLSVAAGDTVLASIYNLNNPYYALSSPVGTVISGGTHPNNPSLLYVSGTTASLSTNGISAASVYGGSVISLQEA